MTAARPRIVAIDWSGAKRANGIAVAELRPGAPGPVTVPPPNGQRWTRGAALDFLCAVDTPAIVGIDCAFALPFGASGYGTGIASKTGPELWREIDTASGAEADFYAGPFADAHASLFWRRGRRLLTFTEPHRKTETAARSLGLGTPQSPFKRIGAAQVGMAGLAGMRVLVALKRRLGRDVAIWPFDHGASATRTVVEIYPTLFRKRAGHGTAKIRDLQALRKAIAAFDFEVPELASDSLTDHDTDALISAAGMARALDDPGVWWPAGLDRATARTEGWIFGVG